MAIVVVGGSGRRVGKTALVCGIVAALPEFRWTAVKITGDAHGKPKGIWEETQAGQGSDTARYLAAGAARALLLTADDGELKAAAEALLATGANLILESNRVVQCLQHDLCLAVREGLESAAKPSFAGVLERADAVVVRAAAAETRTRRDEEEMGARPEFRLAELARISPEMLEWLGAQLGARRSVSQL